MPDLPAGGGGGASMGGFGCLGMADLAVGEWWVFGCVNCELAKNSETMRFVGGRMTPPLQTSPTQLM